MRASRSLVGAIFGAGLAVLALTASSFAAGAIYSPQQALPASAIQEFLANPSALLKQFPNGGALMIARVRDFAASDKATLPAIVELLAVANADQSTAIGTGLGHVALMAVKTDQAYANQIQEAIAKAAANAGAISETSASPGSSQPKIGSAVKTIDEVEGMTERGTQPISVGTNVYMNEVIRTGVSGKAELLFADRTNLSVGPVTTIRLDKFVYDPGGGSGNVIVEASAGAFRFITGLQEHKNYQIKTPFATMGIRGTEFIVVITQSVLEIGVMSGEVDVTTISGQQVTLMAGQELSVNSQGVPTLGVMLPGQWEANFADLGRPITNTMLANALSAFSAATGASGTGAGGGGGGGGEGGGGGSSTPFTGGGGFPAAGGSNANTFVVNAPGNFSLSLPFSMASTPSVTLSGSVSP